MVDEEACQHSYETIKHVFKQVNPPVKPLTTPDIASRVEFETEDIEDTLLLLEQGTPIHSVTTESGRLWWIPPNEFYELDHGDDSKMNIPMPTNQSISQFFESVSDGVIITDTNGIIKYVNPSFESITKYRTTDVYEKSIDSFLTVDQQGTGNLIPAKSPIVSEEIQNTDVEFERKDGGHYMANLSIIPLKNTTEKVPGWLLILSEISRTNDHSAQKNLFELTHQIANIGGWEYHVKTDTVYVTNQARTILELQTDSLALDEMFRQIHQKDRPWIIDGIERAIASKKEFDFDLRTGHKTDPFRWIRVQGVPHTVGANVHRIYGTVQDITDLKRREQKLKEGRTWFRTLFDESPDSIVVHDLSGNIVEVNETLINNIGYERSSLESMHISDIEIGSSMDYLSDIWLDLNTGDTRVVEGVHKRNDGSTYPVEIWINKIKVDGQEQILTLNRDISERKEWEDQLNVLNRLLRHNLSNDMNVIRGFAETIAVENAGIVEEDANKIISQCDRLLETIEKQRTVVDILANRSHSEILDLSSRIYQIIGKLQSELPQATINASVPPTVFVQSMPEIIIAVEELINNAIEHNDQPEPRVNIEIEKSVNQIQITIQDNGPKIPSMDRAVLSGNSEIDPLFHGRGMGLWLVYWIVRLSGGVVESTQRDDRGNIISITLPRPDQTDSIAGYSNRNSDELTSH